MSEAFIKINNTHEISNIPNTGNSIDEILKRVEQVRQETDKFLQKVLDENTVLIKIKKDEKEEIEEEN
jgi:hypothetical protein